MDGRRAERSEQADGYLLPDRWLLHTSEQCRLYPRNEYMTIDGERQTTVYAHRCVYAESPVDRSQDPNSRTAHAHRVGDVPAVRKAGMARDAVGEITTGVTTAMVRRLSDRQAGPSRIQCLIAAKPLPSQRVMA